MADDSAELLRELLVVQREILAELQREAERSAQFRAEAVEQGKNSLVKMNIFSFFMFLIIFGGVFYSVFR